jgi:hypothetical protein
MSDWAAGLIGVIWLLWFVLYRFVTRATLPDEEVEPFWSRASYIGPMLISIALVAWQDWPGWLGARIWPSFPILYWIGLPVTVLGLCFSTWGRAELGANWSGTISVKVGHELVRSGPYRWIRHPMYGGALVAMIGTAVAFGTAHALVGALIALVALAYKARIEEHWLKREFGDAWAAYVRSTWALLPWL